MEYLDIVDEKGNPTGEIVERTVAHSNGIRHRTSHVWIFRKHEGKIQVMLQRRSPDKDSNPGCFDISSAGHIPAGAGFVPSALRELKEELGIDATADELIFCGVRTFHYEDIFYGKPFIDEQVSNVYMLWRDVEPEQLTLQKEEVSEVIWMNFEECMKKVAENSIPHCIRCEELELLNKKL